MRAIALWENKGDRPFCCLGERAIALSDNKGDRPSKKEELRYNQSIMRQL
jgi:hypothetical protein